MNDEFIEINRTISKVYATERGLFHDTGDETVDLPEDLQGASLLKLDVVHAVQLSNAKGEVLILHFDIPKAQNINEIETSYNDKKVRNIDASDNQIQSDKIDQEFVDKSNDMKEKLGIEDNNT